jgi:hypothetical protein
VSYIGHGDGTVPAFYAYAQDSNNGCGQASVASAVRLFNKGRYAGVDNQHLVSTIYRDHPPDSPGAVFGSTPGHVENIAAACGLDHWRTYGPGNAQNALRNALSSNMVMAVLVDLGKLGGAWYNHHYLVAFGCDDSNVHVTNALGSQYGGQPEEQIPWKDFMEAWHAWDLPSPDWQYAGIAMS